MDIKNVYVIYDPQKYSKNDIVKDIQEECYKHNFFFGNDVINLDLIKSHLTTADEVWCFGKCENILDYKIAKEMGCDLWQMK